VNYEPKGRWNAYGVAGTWQLQGNRLLTTMTEQEDDDGELAKLAEPVRRTEVLRVVSPSEFVSTGEDGVDYKYRFCGIPGQ